MKDHNCLVCGTRYKPKRMTSRFCSRKCALSLTRGTPRRKRSGVTVCCLQCGKSIYVPQCRKKTVKYCSRKCQWKFRDRHFRSEIVCIICGSKFSVIKCREKTARYCSRKCYGRSLHNRGTVAKNCPQCGNQFFSSPSQNRKFCSVSCRGLGKRKIATKYPSAARKKLKTNGLISFCAQCGYDRCPDILEIHHIDHDPSNNSPENLAVVCPNCHTEYHYGSTEMKFVTVADQVRIMGVNLGSL